MITIQDFSEVEMKVGRIVSVENHPDADKLVIIRADVGEETPRTLVAGLKDYYENEDMEGKLVVVVTNLEPAQLRGVKSDGMLLAAQEGDDVVLLTLDREIAPGANVL